MLSAGHLLDNRYRLDERIATGGMGDVWRGTDVVLGRVIAVKVLRAAMLSDAEFAARFYGEARMMAAFRHPGVVEVYDYASATDTADDTQCAYLVMAYVEGEPLSTRLKQAGRLGVDETMSIVAQAADALHAAHQNDTVHRDVKPGNLIVKPNGTVILVDFGVARSNAVTSVTGLNAIVGTALYMAPEQVAKGNVSPATDIYALGAVTYHCIAGRPPFDGDNALQVALRHLEDEPAPLPDDVPPAVRELIRRAMAKRPRDRFTSAAEFADAAIAASNGRHPGGGHPATSATALTMPANATASMRATSTRATTLPAARHPGPPPRRRPPRSQLVVMLTVLGLLVVAGGVILALALSPWASQTGEKPVPTGETTAPHSAGPDDNGPALPPLPANTGRPAPRPNAGNNRPSSTPTPTVSATSSTPSTSPSPTAPVTTPPTTTPPPAPPVTDGPTPTATPTTGTGVVVGPGPDPVKQDVEPQT